MDAMVRTFGYSTKGWPTQLPSPTGSGTEDHLESGSSYIRVGHISQAELFYTYLSSPYLPIGVYFYKKYLNNVTTKRNPTFLCCDEAYFR